MVAGLGLEAVPRLPRFPRSGIVHADTTAELKERYNLGTLLPGRGGVLDVVCCLILESLQASAGSEEIDDVVLRALLACFANLRLLHISRAPRQPNVVHAQAVLIEF